MPHRMVKSDGVAKSIAAYDAEIDYYNEHRYAEHEHEPQGVRWPESEGRSNYRRGRQWRSTPLDRLDDGG
jgi:hypothetical protein